MPNKTLKKSDSKAVERLLGLMDKEDLTLSNAQQSITNGSTVTVGTVSLFGQSSLNAELTEYSSGELVLNINDEHATISLSDISGLLSLNKDYNSLYGVLRFSSLIVCSGSDGVETSDSTLTIEADKHAETNLDADFLGIAELPLKEISLSASIKHKYKDNKVEKNISVILVAKLTIEGKDVQITLKIPIAGEGLWGLKLIAPGIGYSLANIAKLIMGSKAFDELPTQIKSIPSFDIGYLEINFEPNQKRINDIRFSLHSIGEWELVKGKDGASILSLKDLGLALNIFVGSTGGYSYDGVVNATAHIGNFEIAASLPLPVTGVLLLHTNTTEPINDLGIFADLLNDTGFNHLLSQGDFKEKFELNINDLGVGIDLRKGVGIQALNYFVLDGEATLDLAIANFSLKLDLNFFIERPDVESLPPGAEKINYIIDAQSFFLIDEATLILAGKYDSNEKGWQLKGGTAKDQDLQIGKLIADLASKFSISDTLPEALVGLRINYIAATFNTQTKDFAFSLETKFPIAGKELDAVINIAITHNDDKYTRKFSGVVKVADLEFDLIFQQEQDADTVFLAAFENNAGKDETIGDLLQKITDEQELLDFANGIHINLKDALLVIDKPAAPATTKILFGLDIGGGLDLSKLPLVGKMLPDDATVRITFQPLVANDDFAGTSLDKVRSLVPSGGFQLPKEVKKGLGFNMQLMVGGQNFGLNLPVGANDVKNQPATAATPAATTTSNTATTALPPAIDNTKWFVIQKQLGPITFGRVGVLYKDSKIYALLDASLDLAGLTISLDGLYVSSTLKPIQPQFGLHGLGIDYKKGPLEIGGAFLRSTATDKQGNTYDTYDGMAIIRTEGFALSAMGSYSYYEGHPSLFIYAFLDTPLGGPAFFFVTGLAAGFGYNRRVVMPGIDGVASFPLVAEVVTGPPGSKNDLGAEIQKLHEVIPPAVGEYFFAVGVRFSSFKIIDSFVLLAVSFGKEFEVDVLGLSTLVLPTPEVGSTAEPLAEVQLALQAVFNPDRGYLKVQAALTAASFILSRNCHLTGGFAFYTWFKDVPEDGANAGDFVLTIGGYHPLFKPPRHYPKVAPLGFNWQVVPELVIKGDFYFALVPSAVMAGGHLSATFHSGGLKAWFNLGADFIISWKPYFYDIKVYVDFGVSYTFELFGTHTISLDLGADLHIWGPEFTGVADIHIWIFTVSVSFGAGSKDEPPALSWDEFRNGFLPDRGKWESVSVTKGLVGQLKDENEVDIYVVNPKDFEMVTTSALPITSSNRPLGGSNTGIHIGSMGIADAVVSAHNISIQFKDETNRMKDVTGDFTFTPIQKNVPGALWGDKLKHAADEPDDQRLIKNACMGFTIKGKPILPSSETHDVDSQNLLNENETFGAQVKFGSPSANLGNEWLKSAGIRNKVANTIEAAHGQRAALLKAVGFQGVYLPNKELADEFLLTAA